MKTKVLALSSISRHKAAAMCRELPKTPKSKLDKYLSDPLGQVLLEADKQMTRLSIPKAKIMSATFWRNWYAVLLVVM